MKFLYAFILFATPIICKAQTVTNYNRSAWTVTPSSEELTGEGPINGRAATMIDGNNATYWVSNFTDNFAQYSHTLVFDMQVSQPVNQIYYVPRNNELTSAYSGSVSFSDNGTVFGAEQSVIFFNTPEQHLIKLTSTQNHRYFRITITQNYADHNAGANNLYITTMAEVGAIYNTTLDGTLRSFTAQSQAVGVQLNWTTSFETNSTTYNITRSADAVNFTTIGSLAASGTTSAVSNYSFTDAAPINGINFYRLELVHSSGPSEISAIIKNAEFPLVNYSSTQSKNLNLFYFIPAGKQPWPDFKHRLDTVFLGLQTYYRNEMQRNGRGNKTFGLVTDATNTQIKIIIVHGRHPFNFYSTNPGGGEGPAILAEINEYMVENPSPFYGAHSQIVSPAFGYNPTTGIVNEQVPVYGSGRNCFSLDYPDLKWSLLGTGGVLGNAATVNIGGTAHEAGHGLNLSHNRTRVSETALGTALMSDGNYTFGQSITSLTATDAAILNHNQVFNPDGVSYYGPNGASISSIHACYSATKNSIIVAGRTTTNGAPVTDIAIYNDPNNGSSPGMGDNKDYDAPTWTAPIIGTDSFYIEMPITELQVNDSSLYEMKIITIQQDGNVTSTKYHYNFANNLPQLTDPAFTPISAVITSSAGANGIVSPAGSTVVSCVGNQTYTFTPNAGYVVADVLVDGVSVGPVTSYTFNTVGVAHTISVSFTQGTLSVTLIDFTATLKGKNTALLQWQTSGEINSFGFDVEMAEGQGVFGKVGFVAAAGNTSSTSNYNFSIPNLKPGINTFRLKIIDADGDFVYSPVRFLKVVNGLDIIVNAYPNPVSTGFANIEVLNAKDEQISISVTNSLGQTIEYGIFKYSATPMKIKLPNAKGEYYIHVTVDGQKPITKKIVKL